MYEIPYFTRELKTISNNHSWNFYAGCLSKCWNFFSLNSSTDEIFVLFHHLGSTFGIQGNTRLWKLKLKNVEKLRWDDGRSFKRKSHSFYELEEVFFVGGFFDKIFHIMEALSNPVPEQAYISPQTSRTLPPESVFPLQSINYQLEIIA